MNSDDADAITPDQISQMRVVGAGVSETQTDMTVRGIRVTIDEPPERGGNDLGPTPPETLLAALVGCTNRIGRKIAAAKGIDIENMSIEVDAVFDRRGVNLEREVDIPFRQIRLTVEVTTTADEADVDALRKDLTRFCPVAKILRQAGTPIHEAWTIIQP